MLWLLYAGGLGGVNLAQVRRWVANTDGSVDVYPVGDSSPTTVAGVGTDAASAAEAMRRITQALDPADY